MNAYRPHEELVVFIQGDFVLLQFSEVRSIHASISMDRKGAKKVIGQKTVKAKKN